MTETTENDLEEVDLDSAHEIAKSSEKQPSSSSAAKVESTSTQRDTKGKDPPPEAPKDPTRESKDEEGDTSQTCMTKCCKLVRSGKIFKANESYEGAECVVM